MIQLVSLFILLVLAPSWGAEVTSIRFQRAKELAKIGKLDEALQEYRTILLDDPDNSEAYLEAGNIRASQGKWSSAVQNYELSLQRMPNQWEALEGLANAHEQQGLKDKAILDWRKLAEKAPKTTQDRAKKHIESLQGAPLGASTPEKETARPSVSSNPDSPEFLQGIKDYQAGKWAKSLESWRKVLAKDHGNSGAFYYAGVCRYNLGEFDKAKLNLEKSTGYPDKGFNAHFYLARIFEKQHQIELARAQYKAYISKTPSLDGKKDGEKRLAALTAPGAALPSKEISAVPDSTKRDSSKQKQAIAPVPVPKPNPEKVVVLESGAFFAIGSATGSGSPESEKALKSAQAKEFNKAIDELKDIRLNYPGTPNALAAAFNLASLYQYLGLTDNLRILCSGLLRESVNEPYRSSLSFMLANAFKDLGEIPAANSILDSIHSDNTLGPTVAQLRLLQSQIAEMQKSEKDIPAHLEKAIAAEKDPVKRSDLLLRLGKINTRQGSSSSAEKAFKDILESCSPYTVEQCRKAQYALADMQFQRKEWDKAITLYRRVVETYDNPDDSPWGLYQIGNALRQKKQYPEALKAYDALIQKFPDSYWTDQAKWNKDDVIWRGQNSKLLAGD